MTVRRSSTTGRKLPRVSQRLSKGQLFSGENMNKPTDLQLFDNLNEMDFQPIAMEHIAGAIWLTQRNIQTGAVQTLIMPVRLAGPISERLSALAVQVETPKPASKSVKVPFQSILDLYHEILCPPLPRCEVLTAKRQGQIRQRWQDKEDGLPELDDWRNFFRHVKVSPFLMGQVASRDRRPFRADIEWLTNATNYAKIAEGKYHS